MVAVKNWQIWIDTGGTFTDCISVSPTGQMQRIKVLSSGALRGRIIGKTGKCQYLISSNWPAVGNIFSGYTFQLLNNRGVHSLISSYDPESGVLELEEELNLSAGNVFEITAHEEAPILCARLATMTRMDDPLPPIDFRLGSTKGTNALLERKGGRVAFITTRGYGDLISIGTQQRPHLFSINIQKDLPLHTKSIELDERVDADGKIISELEEKEIRRVVGELQNQPVDAVAVALLNSYKNPEHEKKLRAAIIEAGFDHVSISSELSSTIKLLPRAETTVVNAYLSTVVSEYLSRINVKLDSGSLKVMTSSGGLVDAKLFTPKDSLLSGPAGGVVGAASIARDMGVRRMLTFDMGGTSTDVARYDTGFEYRYEMKVGPAYLQTPNVHIETVAAGGGSICDFDGFKLIVGPESAGASPGPACYGMNGPLAITDVNLLLGRIDTERFGIPANQKAAIDSLDQLKKRIIETTGKSYSNEELLSGFLTIANEKMAEAISRISIKKGYDPADYALLGFGGAGGQHVCQIAGILGINEIIIPYDAGLLSAYGMGQARIERFANKQVLKSLESVKSNLSNYFLELETDAGNDLQKESFQSGEIETISKSIYLRFFGQDATIEVKYSDQMDIASAFKHHYEHLYGHWVDGQIEVESIKVVVASKETNTINPIKEHEEYSPKPVKQIESYFNVNWVSTPVLVWEELSPGAKVQGPALLVSKNSTVVVEPEWTLLIDGYLNSRIKKLKIIGERVGHFVPTSRERNLHKTGKDSSHAVEMAKPVEVEEIQLELFTNRFIGIAEEMGALLLRTAFSVNIKERLDFSCGLLDENGELVVNAPHIPVHLGGLGICVRTVLKTLDLTPGDVIITNHPGYGGSHLPDITLIAPVFDSKRELIGYLANRAHHAELGGKRPGSMPPDAKNLAEEGVVISPQYLVKAGKAQWTEIKKLLTSGKYPTRAVEENLADLNAGLASIKAGEKSLQKLCDQYGSEQVKLYMIKLKEHAFKFLAEKIKKFGQKELSAKEYLDDGSCLSVKIKISHDKLVFDFQGSSPTHHGNLNANPAIVNSAVIYVLRLLIDEDIPLNEGLMKNVELKIPEGTILNPDFPNEPRDCPAVVGGNVETSQRLVDTLIKAFGLAACSQGTMNNLLFGNDHFGYYETICGGTGAGDGFDGADAVHQHMTNTRITDPETLEHRYPVRLNEFSIRKNSGGEGKWKGGNGVKREIEFLEPVELTVLSQHRKEAPYGLAGGESGALGKQTIILNDGAKEAMSGIDGKTMFPGDRIIIETPGGGGFGK
ncbi:MAG: hydantoinase B/oxoprolinase family protein [Bacteroidetes bacterium]|nr:hydantoinase B/oxoprolinase family protein [Bacteroidota bacterium]MDA1120377.1 hydantoinase B/oxoprolinase family protein [Bacteroidota bacterium]